MLYQFIVVTSQVSKLSLFLGWNITRLQQTCQQELAYPLAVHLVCLVAWHILNVTGVHYPDIRYRIFEYVVHGLPVDSRTLHCHVGNAVLQ